MRRKFIPLPSQELLTQLLDYDPETGALYWAEGAQRSGTQPRVPGDLATHVGTRGYNILSISESKTASLRAARVIWRRQTGTDPEELEVDHKSRDNSDDSWLNLRLATRSQNGINTRHRAKSGHRGVWQRKGTLKWGAKISANGVHRTLGQAFPSREAAIAAYEEAAATMHGGFRAELS